MKTQGTDHMIAQSHPGNTWSMTINLPDYFMSHNSKLVKEIG